MGKNATIERAEENVPEVIRLLKAVTRWMGGAA